MTDRESDLRVAWSLGFVMGLLIAGLTSAIMIIAWLTR